MVFAFFLASALAVPALKSAEEQAAFEKAARFSFRKYAVETCLGQISEKSSGMFDAVSVCTCSADRLLQRPVAELVKNDFDADDMKRVAAECFNSDPSVVALKRR